MLTIQAGSSYINSYIIKQIVNNSGIQISKELLQKDNIIGDNVSPS